MSVVDQAIKLAQQKEQQAAAKREKSDKQKLKQFASLVYRIDDGEEVSPEEVLEICDKCDRTAEQVQEQLDFLQERRDKAAKITELRQDSVQKVGAERKAAEAEFLAAKRKWDKQREGLNRRDTLTRKHHEEANGLAYWLERTKDDVLPRPEEIDA